jgi:hypothetical protein
MTSLFLCPLWFFIGFFSAGIFQSFINDPFYLTVHATKFVGRPFFKGFIHVLIYSQYKILFSTHE